MSPINQMTRIIGLVERRKKRAICSSNAVVKFLLLFPIAILWALVTWSHYRILSKKGATTLDSSAGGSSSRTFPPIDKVVAGKYNVTRDLDFLIDFAIVGFPKCGTSTMMEYLEYKSSSEGKV